VIARLLALVIPLGLDTLVVAAALGLSAPDRVTRRRISILFPAFEAVMPLIGLALGAPIGRAVGRSASLIAIGVLLVFGLNTLLGSEEREERALARLANADVRGLLLLGLSISLDELAIGFTLGLLHLPVELVIVLIAIQALVVTRLGLRLGHRLTEGLREAAERLAGLTLALLALGLLAERLLG
jgi:putative Mn2+ efflux pump MntP